MLAVWVNTNVLRTFRAKQMHCVRNHHGALVEVVFVVAVGLADAVRRRRKRRHQVLEIQSPPPYRISLGIYPKPIDRSI